MTVVSKYNYSNDSKSSDNKSQFDNILIGKVVSVTDEYDGNRIKVRVKGVDDKVSDSDLPFAFPLIPKFIGIVPSIGESVLIFSFNDRNKFQGRLWVGPIISQPQKLEHDPHNFSAGSLLDSGVITPELGPSTVPEAKGIYPKKNNISIQGRDNTDITFKPREILLRAGKFEVGNNLKFNKENMGYIQIKHNVIIDSKKDTKGSVTNIVSNKINLLSHNGSPRFVLDDQDDMISDSELEKILTKTQPLVYGNELINFITLVKKFIIGHSHAYHGLSPVKDTTVDDILKFNLNNLLSKNIRIN